MPTMVDNNSISAILLAGGQGSRMGGQDKGLSLLNSKPLIQHMLDKLTGQVTSITISANRNIEQYLRLGHRVIKDQAPDFQGPLSGIISASKNIQTDYILVLPCDMPGLPDNLVSKMAQSIGKHAMCVAHDGLRQQSLILLFHKRLILTLEDSFNNGLRKVTAWSAQCNATIVRFNQVAIDQNQNQNRQFSNINTADELNTFALHDPGFKFQPTNKSTAR